MRREPESRMSKIATISVVITFPLPPADETPEQRRYRMALEMELQRVVGQLTQRIQVLEAAQTT